MSIVGPRPNVKRETDLYSQEEQHILSIKPGITDFSSIIFSDEGEILENSDNPDLDYNQIIRPYKSRLALFYIDNINYLLDLKIIVITVLSIVKRKIALIEINKILISLNACSLLLEVSLRKSELAPHAPPGHDSIVTSRDL